MKFTIFLVTLLVCQVIAQTRNVRAQLPNLGISRRIPLPNLGFAQSFIPPSLADAKNIKIKVTETKLPNSFQTLPVNGGVTASGRGNSFGFSSSGAFSSVGDNIGSGTNGIGGSHSFSSSGTGIGQENFGISSPSGQGNLDAGISLDTDNFFDKNLHEPGVHVAPFPIIPVNLSGSVSPSQQNFGVSGNFHGASLPQTKPPQPFNHQPSIISTNVPTRVTTSPPPPFNFNGNALPLPQSEHLPENQQRPQPGPLPGPQSGHVPSPQPAPQSGPGPVPQPHPHLPPQLVPEINDLTNRFAGSLPPAPSVSLSLDPSIPLRAPELSGEALEQFLQQEWSDFQGRFNKVYRNAEEARNRREIFIENRAKIIRFNMEYAEGKRSFVHKINEFSDLLLHEFNENFNGYNRSRREPTIPLKPATTFVPSANVVFPDSVDWRMVGAVGPVKSQGKCAACWAFAAAGALEGHHFRKSGSLVEVSVQNLIDCTEPYGNNGCSGGLMDPAFEYVRDNNGVDSEQSYPFEERNGECRFKRENVVATCTGFVDIGENDEKGLEIALATLGPVTAAIDAGRETFQFYSEGIYDDPTCGNKPEQMNHAVLIVGYGQEADGRKYWLVKNSYGPNWGIGGYVKIAKENNNQCGIAIQASYPLV